MSILAWHLGHVALGASLGVLLKTAYHCFDGLKSLSFRGRILALWRSLTGIVRVLFLYLILCPFCIALLGLSYKQIVRESPSLQGLLGLDESFWSAPGLFIVSSVISTLSAASISVTTFGFLAPIAGLFIPDESRWIEDASRGMRSAFSIREVIILNGTPLKRDEHQDLKAQWARLSGKDRSEMLEMLSMGLYSNLSPGVLEATDECEKAIAEGRLNRDMDGEWLKLFNALFEERARYIRNWLRRKRPPKHRCPSL